MKHRTMAILLLLSGTGTATAQVYEEDLKDLSLGPAAGDSRALVLSWEETGQLHADISSLEASEVYYDIRISREEPPWAPYWDDPWYLDAAPVPGQPDYDPEIYGGSIVIGGLDPGTTYHVAWRIEFLAPDGTWTTDVSMVSAVTTTDGVAPSLILDLRPVPSAPGSASFAWTAPGDDGNAGRARRYDLRWSPADPSTFPTPAAWYASATVAALPEPLAAGKPESVILEGLPASARIHAAIRSSDEIPNWSAMSAIVAAEILQAPPAPGGGGGGGGGCAGSAAGGLLALLLPLAVFSTRPAALR